MGLTLMEKNLVRGGVAPSHISTPSKIDNLDAFVLQERPQFPVAVLRPDKLTKRAQEFTTTFPGRVLYAVKCNPDVRVLRALMDGGVNSFDCASIGEVRLVKSLMRDATIYFMHPIKSREAIFEAYFTHGIRAFVLDSSNELQKILDVTDYAKDLKLFVRMASPKQKVATDFSAKFGAPPMMMGALLQSVRPHCAQLGISFHVGTHCMDVRAYEKAVTIACDVISTSGVCVDALDIGGGFPADLDPTNPPPPIGDYFDIVKKTLAMHNKENLELLCEPGRSMVAAGGQLVVRIEGRKGDLLFMNDGTYGGMLEGGPLVDLVYPHRVLRAQGDALSSTFEPFRLAGPSCDSVDMMKGPYMFPDNIGEGDYIVLDQLGAYGEVTRTNFNGFDQVILVELAAKKAKAKSRKAA